MKLVILVVISLVINLKLAYSKPTDKNAIFASQLRQILSLRRKYMDLSGQQFPCLLRSRLDRNSSLNCCQQTDDNSGVNVSDSKNYKLTIKSGIIIDKNNNFQNIAPSVQQFSSDYQELIDLTFNNDLMRGGCKTRLDKMLAQFETYRADNLEGELIKQKQIKNIDTSMVPRVDNHIHSKAVFSQKHLVRFIKRKLATDCNRTVYQTADTTLTLCQLFASENITLDQINEDTLDMKADYFIRNRFENFASRYGKPFRSRKIGKVFLDYDNYINGSYYAELIHEWYSMQKNNSYAEILLQICGFPNLWARAADWLVTNNLLNSSRIQWAVSFGACYFANYEDALNNHFMPIYQATIDPKSNPNLAEFLKKLKIIDIAGGEPGYSSPFDELSKPPKMIFQRSTFLEVYFTYANLVNFNSLRKKLGLNQLQLRPHLGETGSVQHMALGYLLAGNINHGIQLRFSDVFQYFYYLTEIGLAIAPTSSNFLWLDMQYNPLYDFFKKGLLVSVNTDDPTQFQQSDNPLAEEYAAVASFWRLTDVDVCELARNSVIISGLKHQVKQKLIGKNYHCSGQANDESLTNIPNQRLEFRRKIYLQELDLLI